MKKSTIIYLSIIAVLFVSVLFLLSMNFQKPIDVSTPTTGIVPITSPATEPIADWKNYENKQFGFSFKYPSSLPYNVSDIIDYKNHVTFDYWIINLETKAPKCDPTGLACGGKFTYSIKKLLTVNQKKAVYYETVGMAGPQQDLIIDLGNYKLIRITFISNPVESLDGPVSVNNRRLFDQILSTFKFTDNTNLGMTTGSLCYPSEGIPPGTITAKNISTNKTFFQRYEGTSVAPSATFSFQLEPGTYHFQFATDGGLIGYYDKCAQTMSNVDCSPDENHQHFNVIVDSGKKISGVSICDFYYSQNQEIQLKSTF